MDTIAAQLILKDRRIAYAITDRNLNVVELSGTADILRGESNNWLGHALVELAPELVGSEDVLADLLAGVLPRFQLAWVNRELPDGQIIYLNMVDLPYPEPAGRIAGLIHLVQDVTEMGRLEQRMAQQRNELRLLRDELNRQNLDLIASNTELQRLDEMKSAFVSIAAHELRTPLSPINGYVELLLEHDGDPLTERQVKYLQIIQSSARRLLAITNDILDLTRIEAGRIELVLQPTDLVRLIEAEVAEYAPQLEAKAQRLTLCAPLGLPLALCDGARGMQIIGNLLSNASKYTPAGGGITLSLSLAEEPGFLQVAVADNGVGIALTDQTKLFERFFRADSATRTGAGGAGLGLYIVRSLVELHGGRVWFESALNRGSTFFVTFPIADSEYSQPNVLS
ncbi:MAG: hypothetical protein CVU38_15235 [Chloroflexi bacterium HGW-Chloroflexi-1]|nr:MAG: hypothetical protein CVU38_15235 [Chloroflexi bacterium HGW-Chloroflexi-1]